MRCSPHGSATIPKTTWPKVETHDGRDVLWAEQGPFALALTAGANGSEAYGKRSVGCLGVSDGWQDFNRNGRMTWTQTKQVQAPSRLAGRTQPGRAPVRSASQPPRKRRRPYRRPRSWTISTRRSKRTRSPGRAGCASAAPCHFRRPDRRPACALGNGHQGPSGPDAWRRDCEPQFLGRHEHQPRRLSSRLAARSRADGQGAGYGLVSATRARSCAI